MPLHLGCKALTKDLKTQYTIGFEHIYPESMNGSGDWPEQMLYHGRLHTLVLRGSNGTDVILNMIPLGRIYNESRPTF